MSRNDDHDGAWACVFSVSTPWDELQVIIDERINEALHTFLQTLLDAPDLSDTQRAHVWAFGAATIREQHRATLEAGWRRLQLEAEAPSGSVQ
jgi:hypothetical protein